MTAYRYRANITYAPSTDLDFPWNVGIYDMTRDDDDQYVWSFGATDLQDAIAVAYTMFREYGQKVLT